MLLGDIHYLTLTGGILSADRDFDSCCPPHLQQGSPSQAAIWCCTNWGDVPSEYVAGQTIRDHAARAGIDAADWIGAACHTPQSAAQYARRSRAYA